MVHEHVTALRVEGLGKRFRKSDGQHVDALAELDLTVETGECLSVIGESGSGKSTLARILMGLETPDAGVVEVRGARPGDAARGGEGGVAVVLQDPADALDPRYSVLAAIAEPLRIRRRQGMSRTDIRDRVTSAMESVGLGEQLLESRVSRLSGGQQQRVGIARALVTKPSLLILDEPTSALDPSVQAQILDLLMRLQRAEHLSVLLITHDLAVAAYLGDRICVLRNGRVVEVGSADDVWRRSRHPYTRALMSASSFDAAFEFDDTSRPGAGPGAAQCEFADICGHERARSCAGGHERLVPVDGQHWVAPSCLTSGLSPSQHTDPPTHHENPQDKKETPV